MRKFICENPRCGRVLGFTDGKKICFGKPDDFSCLTIRGEYEKVECKCGWLKRVDKDLGLKK